MKLIKINEFEVEDIKEFAFDGCHKFYLITSEQGKQDLYSVGWKENDLFSIEELEQMFYNSCPLRFINLDKTKDFETIVPQCTKSVTFVYLDNYGCEIIHTLNFG